jgi:sulfur-oxidizing protein SoxY
MRLMMDMVESKELSRRRVLLAAGMGGAAALGGLLPIPALGPSPALATPQQAQELLAKLVKAEPKEGRITLKAPEIAENGNTVPVTITVDSPMTDKDYVKAVHLVSEGNPNPGLATFNFTPANGKAEVEVRIRMAGSQKLIAVAEMSDGTAWRAVREVKVTIGGCGG